MDAMEIGKGILAAQPFSVLVGAELTKFADGVAELRIPFRADLAQQNGFVHGGVLAYAVDNSVSFAAGTVLGASILTSGVAVTYLRPAKTGVRAIATVVGQTRRQAVVTCEIYDEEDILVATGYGTVAAVDR